MTMTDQPRTIEATWLPIDSRRALPAADAAIVTRYGEANMAHDRLHLELPAILHMMRDNMAGQPRAASYTPSTASAPTLPDDDEPATGHHDPTGDAGIGPDKARGDHRKLMRLLEQHVQLTMAIETIVGNYPTSAELQAQVEPTPGDDWCIHCWKDGKYLSPIATKPDGTPRRRGCCRWCGDFITAEGFEPPTWMLHARHRGETITRPMVDKAHAEWRRLNPPKAKKRGRKGKTTQ